MDCAERRGQTTHSEDSSTGEPVAVRRRISLDGSFTGSEVRRPDGQQSPASEASRTGNAGCDALPGTHVVPSVSGEPTYVLAGSSNASEGGKRRRASVLSNASGAPDDVRHEKEVSCQTSASCKLNGSGETSERGNGGNSGRDASESYDDTDDAGGTDGSGTGLRNLSSPFGGSRYSVQELALAFERVSEALGEEKKREDSVVTVVADVLSDISRLSFRFYSVATVHLGKFVSRVENRDLRESYVCCDELEKRLDAIKAYIHGISTEAETRETPVSPVTAVHRKDTGCSDTNLIQDDSSDEDQVAGAMRVHVGISYPVRRASNSVRKVRNVVVRQRKVMSCLCAMGERLVSKAAISCKLILHCLKAVAAVLTPAVGSYMLIAIVVRALDGKGRSLPEFANAAKFAAHWTNEALLDAERAIRLHKDAREALKAASRDLDIMRGYEPYGGRVLRNVLAAGDRFLDLVRQSDVSLEQIRTQEWKMKKMRHLLTPHLIKMRSFGVLTEQRSAMCSDTLSLILKTLSIATQSSSNAIEGATKAVEDIFIPASISLEERAMYRFQMEVLFK